MTLRFFAARALARRPLQCCALALLLTSAGSAGSVARANSDLGAPAPSSIVTGKAYVDTFPADPATLRYNAAALLINDGWHLPANQAATDTMVTAWKPLKNLFVRMLFGSVQAQCRLGFHGLNPQRTRVTFSASAATSREGALASLRANADRYYAKAAHGWAAHMRRMLDGRDMPKPKSFAAAGLVTPATHPAVTHPAATE